MECKLISSKIINPIPKAWDYVFLKRETFWIIVHTKDGRQIGGKYDTDSYVTTYPIEEQIYLEEVWELDDKNKFLKPIDRSAGIIISKEEISFLELFI